MQSKGGELLQNGIWEFCCEFKPFLRQLIFIIFDHYLPWHPSEYQKNHHKASISSRGYGWGWNALWQDSIWTSIITGRSFPFLVNDHDCISRIPLFTKVVNTEGTGFLEHQGSKFELQQIWSETRGEMPPSLLHSSLCHSSLWSLWLGSCKIAAAPHWRSPMLWKTVQHLLCGYFLPKTTSGETLDWPWQWHWMALKMTICDKMTIYDNIWQYMKIYVNISHDTEPTWLKVTLGVLRIVQRVENLSIS